MKVVFSAAFLCAMVSGAAAVVCGRSLGMLFGGIAALTLIVPNLVLATGGMRGCVAIVAACVVAVASVWGAMIPLMGAGPWCEAVLVAAAYAMALAGVVQALRWTRMPDAAASGATIVLALLWLSWPVWMSPLLDAAHGESIAAWLVPAHPLFVLNGLYADSGAWVERTVMYRSTVLGQDVPFSLPATILWALVMHGAIGVAGGLVMMRQRAGAAVQEAGVVVVGEAQKNL